MRGERRNAELYNRRSQSQRDQDVNGGRREGQAENELDDRRQSKNNQNIIGAQLLHEKRKEKSETSQSQQSFRHPRHRENHRQLQHGQACILEDRQ